MQKACENPVFIVGTGRCGTTLLYHMILSNGNFVIYRSETHVFNVIAFRFPDLGNIKTKRKFLNLWMNSSFFARSNLDKTLIASRLLSDCHNPGDFLCTLMESMAQSQGVSRWSDCTPGHLIYMDKIKQSIPDAKFIHIIRDGRDVALSFNRLGWTKRLPWDSDNSLFVAGLRWRWLIKKGRQIGNRLGNDYLEIRYEDLINRPKGILAIVSSFIGETLDLDRINTSGIGSVKKPNSSFYNETQGNFNPIGRWKDAMSCNEKRIFIYLIGDLLRELGYDTDKSMKYERISTDIRILKRVYSNIFEIKYHTKNLLPFVSKFISEEIFQQ